MEKQFDATSSLKGEILNFNNGMGRIELFRLATLGVPARMPVPWSIDGGVVGGRRISQRGAFPRARAAAMRARALLTALTAIALAAIGNAEKSKFCKCNILIARSFTWSPSYRHSEHPLADGGPLRSGWRVRGFTDAMTPFWNSVFFSVSWLLSIVL